MKKTIKKIANVALGFITAAAVCCFLTDSDPARLVESGIFHFASFVVAAVAGVGFWYTLEPEQREVTEDDII